MGSAKVLASCQSVHYWSKLLDSLKLKQRLECAWCLGQTFLVPHVLPGSIVKVFILKAKDFSTKILLFLGRHTGWKLLNFNCPCSTILLSFSYVFIPMHWMIHQLELLFWHWSTTPQYPWCTWYLIHLRCRSKFGNQVDANYYSSCFNYGRPGLRFPIGSLLDNHGTRYLAKACGTPCIFLSIPWRTPLSVTRRIATRLWNKWWCWLAWCYHCWPHP